MNFLIQLMDQEKWEMFYKKSQFDQPKSSLNSTDQSNPLIKESTKKQKIDMESHSEIEVFRKQLDENFYFFEVF